jgi:hypothetical protein
MKLEKPILVVAATVLALPLFAAFHAGATPSPCCSAIVAVDEPPPDPLDCAFCGGDPELHKQRIQALLRLSANLFASMVP